MIRNPKTQRGGKKYISTKEHSTLLQNGEHIKKKKIKLEKALSEGKPVLSSSLPEIYRPRTVTTKM